MSGKKPPKPQAFVNSPFKSLRGLSALEAPKGKAGKEPVKVEPKQEPLALDEERSFDEEMSLLGVAPLSGSRAKVGGPPPPQPVVPPVFREQQERRLFLEALGALDTTFQDEWPVEVAGEKVVPRRMKQVEQGKLLPEAQLDLHGLTIEQSTAKVGFFLNNARYHGYATVLIITGKGLHSSDEPVLRRAVERQLAGLSEQVIEWGLAPRRYGGSGALVVFLRRQEAE